MTDRFGRNIDYLRLSITDRCNLRCKYCMPEGVDLVEHRDLLRYEELLSVARAAVSLGITHFKVTGGEPLVRRGCLAFLKELKVLPGVETVSLTTNGVLLKEQIDDLTAAGLDAVNISLDTVIPEKFKDITGFDKYGVVIEGVEAALENNLRVKINSVLMAGMNDDEWHDLALFAKKYPLDVRFIEMMPIGYGKTNKGVSNDRLKELFAEKYTLTEDNRRHGYGPAKYYKIDGFKGSIGFISAMHGKFCKECNRIRLTSTGLLKPCLCYGEGAELKPVLRGGSTADVKELMKKVIENKPAEHCFEHDDEITETKQMVGIGG